MSDFDYDLPRELIAQTPIEPRDASRLLVVHRASGTLMHSHFRDIGKYLHPGDLLIANQSRVLPARLFGHRAETGGAVEVLLLAERPDIGPDCWEALVRPGRRMREGNHIVFDNELSSSRGLSGAKRSAFTSFAPTADSSATLRSVAAPTDEGIGVSSAIGTGSK